MKPDELDRINRAEEIQRYTENRCEALEKENAELNDKLNNLASVAEVRLANWQKYEKENAELKERNGELAGQKAILERWLGEAKALIKNLIRVTYDEGWNYSLGVKARAEQFLKE